MINTRFLIVKYLYKFESDNRYSFVALVVDKNRHLHLPNQNIIWDNNNNEITTDNDDVCDSIDNVECKFQNEQLYAIKYVNEKNNKYIIDEIRILKCVSEKNSENKYGLCKIIGQFVYNKGICMIFPYHKDGTLTKLIKEKYYDINKVKSIARSIIYSVNFLHNTCNIIHTDIKPENIVFDDDNLFIVDFGSSVFTSEKFNYLITTRYYRAPEVILNIQWDEKCDVWSIGCVLYELVTRRILFNVFSSIDHLNVIEETLSKSIAKVYYNKCNNHIKYKYFDKYGNLMFVPETKVKNIYDVMHIDANLYDLMIKCLEVDFEKRPNISDLLNHKFISD